MAKDFDFEKDVPAKYRTQMIDDTEGIAAEYKQLTKTNIEVIAAIGFKLRYWDGEMKAEGTFENWFGTHLSEYFTIRTARRYMRLSEVYGADIGETSKMPVDLSALFVLAENSHETAREARIQAWEEYTAGSRVNQDRARAIVKEAIARAEGTEEAESQPQTVDSTAKEIRAPESDSDASEELDASDVAEEPESQPVEPPTVAVGTVETEDQPLTQEDANRDIACLIEQYGLGMISAAVSAHPVLGAVMEAQFKKRLETAKKPKPAKKPATEKPDKGNKARPGSLQAVKNYCKEKGLSSVDPEAWWDHYESNGWKVGRNAMKDWKAACRQWNRSNKNGDDQPPPTLEHQDAPGGAAAWSERNRKRREASIAARKAPVSS